GAVALPAGQRDDEQVLEHPARIARHQRPLGNDRALGQRVSQVDAEVGHVPAGARVDRADESLVEEHQPPVRAVGALPVVDPARPDAPGGLALPQLAPGRGIERGDLPAAGLHVHRAVDDDRVELRRCALAGRVFPDDFEFGDVLGRDLGEGRVLRAVRTAEVLVPAEVVGFRRRRMQGGERGGEKQEASGLGHERPSRDREVGGGCRSQERAADYGGGPRAVPQAWKAGQPKSTGYGLSSPLAYRFSSPGVPFSSTISIERLGLKPWWRMSAGIAQTSPAFITIVPRGWPEFLSAICQWISSVSWTNHSLRSLPWITGSMCSSLVTQQMLAPVTAVNDGFQVTSARAM